MGPRTVLDRRATAWEAKGCIDDNQSGRPVRDEPPDLRIGERHGRLCPRRTRESAAPGGSPRGPREVETDHGHGATRAASVPTSRRPSGHGTFGERRPCRSSSPGMRFVRTWSAPHRAPSSMVRHGTRPVGPSCRCRVTVPRPGRRAVDVTGMVRRLSAGCFGPFNESVVSEIRSRTVSAGRAPPGRTNSCGPSFFEPVRPTRTNPRRPPRGSLRGQTMLQTCASMEYLGSFEFAMKSVPSGWNIDSR